MSRLTLETNLNTIYENARAIRKLIPEKTRVLSVVKADAYGHGSVQVAKRLEDKGVTDYFAVATPQEGACLREGGVKLPILVLGYADEEDCAVSVKYGLAQAVYSPRSLRALARHARALGKNALAHLKIDSGMHRIGVSGEEDLARLLDEWKNCPNVLMTGMFSHFSDAEASEAYTELQFETFMKRAALVRANGFQPLCHIAASSAMTNPRYQLDMVREGIALYGVGAKALMPLVRPAQTLKTKPVRVFAIRAGEAVGYSRKFIAPRDTVIMTLPCGYGDGYPRCLSGKADVLVNGRRARIIGNVCMDMMMADVTDIDGVTIESEVVLLGKQGDEAILPTELAALADTIPYEIMLGFSGRVNRAWVY